MTIHICTEAMQPATSWTDTHSEEPMPMSFEPEKMLRTVCCGRQLPAKDCVVQSCYDGLLVWCAPGKGCKDPQVIAEWTALRFANRSAGQKRRWAKARTEGE